MLKEKLFTAKLCFLKRNVVSTFSSLIIFIKQGSVYLVHCFTEHVETKDSGLYQYYLFYLPQGKKKLSTAPASCYLWVLSRLQAFCSWSKLLWIRETASNSTWDRTQVDCTEVTNKLHFKPFSWLVFHLSACHSIEQKSIQTRKKLQYNAKFVILIPAVDSCYGKEGSSSVAVWISAIFFIFFPASP